MQTTSELWKSLLAGGDARLEARAIIAGVEYTDISAPSINRALMQGGLSIGNAVSATCSLDIRGAGAIPRSAEVQVQMRLTDGTQASEWLPAGTYYISHRTRDAVTLRLTLQCYDAMMKGNAVWEPSEGSWPRNMSDVAEELRALIGVTMDSRTTIPTGGLYVMDAPGAGMTVQEALGKIAQACGGNWIITPANALRLVSLGATPADTAIVSGVTGGINDLGTGTVTGIRNTWEDVTDLVGDDSGIVLETALVPALAAELGAELIGKTYQAYRLDGAVYDPAAELGDAIQAGANGEINALLNSEAAILGPAFRGELSSPEAGEMSDEYPYIGASQRTLNLAKAYAQEVVEKLDDDLTQQEIFNRLTDNGAAQGLLLYDGQLYVNASYIRSGTLILGGLNNVNGTLLVLDADENNIVTLNNAGADITSGSLTAYSEDRTTRTKVEDGQLSFEFLHDIVSPPGWLPFASIRRGTNGINLLISGNETIKITNKSSGADTEYAEIDLNNDSISLHSYNARFNTGGDTHLDIHPKGVNVTIDNYIVGNTFAFEMKNGQSSNPLDIGNGGTGGATADAARDSLDVYSKGEVDAIVQQGSISGGSTVTLTFARTGAHILALSRRNQNNLGVAVLMDRASSSYTVIGGTVPSTITITKDTSSGDVTVQNSATFAVQYLLI